jgi:hypothetical protein
MADYSTVVAQNPVPGMLQALQVGSNIGASIDARTLAAQQAQAAQDRNAQIDAAFDLVHNDPTAENYAALANILPPEMGKSVRESFAMLDESKAKTTLDESARVFAAFKSGNPEVGLNLMQEKAQAYMNAGQEDKAKQLQAWIDIYNAGPDGPKLVEDLFGFTIAQMPGGKDAIESINKFATEQRAAAAEPQAVAARLLQNGLTEAQTNKVIAETRKLGLEADSMEAEIKARKDALPPARELSQSAEKLVNDSVIAASKASALTKQYTTLAADFESAISTAGLGAKTTELISRLLGTEKEPTALRQEYLRMRNTAVLEMLPPGVASDKDIEIALAAFPTETSSPANISGFLRGMAKLQAYESAVNGAKAEWIQQNGNLGTASTDMQVGNRTVLKGGRFSEFIEAYLPNTSVLQRTSGVDAAQWLSPTVADTPQVKSMKDFLKTRWPAEAAKIDGLDEAGLKSEYPKTLKDYSPAANIAVEEVDY